MSITINEFKLPISAPEAAKFLAQETDSFGIFFDVDRCYELAGILQLENVQIQKEFNELCCKRVSMDDKNAVMQALMDMGVSRSDFDPTHSGKLSMRATIKEQILQNPIYDEDIHKAITLHNKYTSNKRNKGAMTTFATLPNSVALSQRNRRMSVGRPTWDVLSTSRIAARDPGIQGIPRTMGDIITEPKGYTLIRCDSGQIEPRINFSYFVRDELIMNLITHYNDAYFGLMHYATAREEDIRRWRDDWSTFVPITITDEVKDMRQNIKRLTNAGSYGSSNLGDINPALAKAYDIRIVKHPKRLALERQVTQDVERGVDTFYGAFGTPVTPDATEKYAKGDSGWNGHLIRCGINNPVQTTASELMMFSINEARSILSRAKDSHVCYYKHDEACFYVSDEDMSNGIGDELADVTAYNVKGWIPIESDCVIGVKEPYYDTYIA